MIVKCPETITSPAPSEQAQALGLAPNMVCGAEVNVLVPSPFMSLRCPYGHTFLATPADAVGRSEDAGGS